MNITIRAPHGLEIEAEFTCETPDGTQTQLRLLGEAYHQLVSIDIAEGLAEPFIGTPEEDE